MMLRLGVIVWLLLLVLVAVIKIVYSDRCLSDEDLKEKPPKREPYYNGKHFNITLVASNRTSHKLVSEVTKIFLTEVLGYINVSIIQEDDEFEPDKALEYMRKQDSNQIPIGIVNMEIWVHCTSELVIPRYEMTECGLLTERGSINWFIPKNFERHEDSWLIFTKLESASRLAINETYIPNMVTKGEEEIKKLIEQIKTKNENETKKIEDRILYVPELCNNSEVRPKCALLVTGYFLDFYYVTEYIDKLKLYVKVAFVAEEQFINSLTKNSSITEENRSLVILYYSPSRVIPSDLEYVTPFKFPCESKGLTCYFVSYNLKKVVWDKLKQADEFAFDAINKITFNPTMYKDLLDRLSNKSDNEETNEKTACEWLKDNLGYVQKKWIPKKKEELIIGGIAPMTGDIYNRGASIQIAANMAATAINANSSILRGYTIKVTFNDGKCKSDAVLKSFIQFIASSDFKQLIGVLGPACSETVEPLIGVTSSYKTPVISYAAEGSSFDNREKYPYFFRTIGENKQYKYVYAQLLEKLGWYRVASLTEDGQKYTEYISYMQDILRDKNITFVANIKFPREAKVMTKYLQDLKEKRAKIIIADVYDKVARKVMCEAYKLNMTAFQGYVWFLPLWLKRDWYETDKYNQEGDEQVQCNTTMMNVAINGYLSISHAELASNNSITPENITVGEWYEKYHSLYLSKNSNKTTFNDSSISNYIGYAYDAVWTYAYALDRLIHEDKSYLLSFHDDEKTINRFTEIIAETDFNGVTGRIKFYGGSSRYSTINILQFIDNGIRVVGKFEPNISDTTAEVIDGTLDLNISNFKWLSGIKPDDGSEPPVVCFLNGLAVLLDVSCDTTTVILNIIVFGLLGAIFTVAFIIFKRKYDEKVRLHEEYMRSLGLDLSHTETSSLDIWEIPRDRVVINRKIGEGAFGTVYGGEAFFSEKGWLAVAVKTLKVGSSTDEKLDFLSEVEVMKRFEHKNIIKLLGVCVKCEPVLTVMEFMLYGDLKTYLLARRHLVNDKKNYEDSDEISNKRLTAMALDVSRALSYLAQLKYVHRDIASRNCLVNAQRMVKLGDFGMTRPMYENDYYRFNRKGMLPVRWMSPESLGLGIFTPASDVWSYGVLLYEIVTFGSFPFQGMSNNEVLSHVKAGNSLVVPKKVKTQLENLMYSCWNVDNSKRPTAPEIVEFLATNPRIVSPCLDVPLASVQMDMNLSDNMQKFSLPWPSQRPLSQIRVEDSRSIDSPMPLLLDLNSQDDDQNLDPLLVRQSGEQENISPLLDSTKTSLLKQTWPQDSSNVRDSQSYKYVNLQPGMIKLNCEPGRNGSVGNIQMEERTSMLPEERVNDNMSVL